MKLRTSIGVLAMLLAVMGSAVAAELEPSLAQMAKELGAQMSEKKATKVAVYGFSDLNSYQSALGDFIAEELTTGLFGAGQFDVVERRELTRIISEHELYGGGGFDESALPKLKQLLGVEVLITGSITDLGDRIKVNARAINVETAKVFGVSAVSVERDATIDQLLAQASSAGSSNKGGAKGAVNQPSNVFFRNAIIHIVPTGVLVNDERTSVRLTAEIRNTADQPLRLAKLYGYTSFTPSTELGHKFDVFKSKMQGLPDVAMFNTGAQQESSYILIDSRSHVQVTWEFISENGVPIAGDNLTLRGKLATLTPGGPKEIDYQLANIKLK